MSGLRPLRVCAWAFVGYALLRALFSAVPFPDLDRFIERPYSTSVYDRSGRLLAVEPLEDGLRRQWTDLSDVPGDVVSAFLAAKDRKPHPHIGTDPTAAIHTTTDNRRAERIVPEASTVPIQLARLIRETADPPRSATAKTRETSDATPIETRLPKRHILEP